MVYGTSMHGQHSARKTLVLPCCRLYSVYIRKTQSTQSQFIQRKHEHVSLIVLQHVSLLLKPPGRTKPNIPGHIFIRWSRITGYRAL